MNAIGSNLQELKRKLDAQSNRDVGPNTRRQKTRPTRGLLFVRIAANIRQGLEFPHVKINNKNDAVRIFAEDIKKLGSIIGQWENFVNHLAGLHFKTSNLGVLSENDRRRLLADMRSIFDKVKLISIDEDRVLVDELLRQKSSKVIQALENQIEKIIVGIVDQIFAHFELLKQKHILGSISWADDENCHFDDWKHEFDAKVESSEIELLQARIRLSNRDDEIKTRWVREELVRSRNMGTVRHTAIHREQHLMLARRAKLSTFPQTIPRQYLPTLSQIPGFLLSEITIVSGESFRNESEFHTIINRKWVNSRTEKRLQVHNDPAVVLGDTVLFAWDDVECHQEKHDQYADSKREFAIANAVWALVALAASILVYLTTHDFTIIAKSILLLPCVFTSLILAQRAVADFATYKRTKLAFSQRLTWGAGWLILSLALCLAAIGVVNLSWVDVLVSTFVGGLGVVLLIKAVRPFGN